jgi:hypothetical protein
VNISLDEEAKRGVPSVARTLQSGDTYQTSNNILLIKDK